MAEMDALAVRMEERIGQDSDLATYVSRLCSDYYTEGRRAGYKVGHADGYDAAQAEHGM